MRKLFMIFYVVLFGILCIPVASADFMLPASLTVIEENAFMSTAADAVTIQDAVISIGDYAFANIPTLQSVEIPQSVSFIADNAFRGSESATIYGVAGSYAELWTAEHGMLFAETALLKGHGVSQYGSVASLSWLLCGFLPIVPMLGNERFSIVFGRMRVRRRFAELYPVLFDFP